MPRKKHPSGFVYVWFDRKHKRYYVGCHWGPEDDGYICSSTWMRNSYRNRPQDFKRRVVSRVFTDRVDLLKEEQRWLDMIKPEEIKVRYYNVSTSSKNPWWARERPEIIEKISETSKDRKWSDEQKAKLKGRTPWNKGKTGYTVELKETDRRRGRPSWNAGMKTGPLSDDHRAKLSNARKAYFERKRED